MLVYNHGGDIYSRPVELDFSVNINPFGMPEPVQQAIVDNVASYASYPDPFCRSLRAGLAQAESVPAENILCGNGAADLIYRLCLALRPGRVLVPVPAFTDYARAARLAGAEVTEHLLQEETGFLLDEAFIECIQPGLDMVFLCTPNNPTGRLIAPGLLEQILERCEQTGTLLVLDECFQPFAGGHSLVPRTSSSKKLLVLRAFTKIYAMAGLRLGYLITSDRDLLSELAGFGQPWSVSAVAQVAGLAALDCTREVARVQEFIREERPRLARALAGFGFKVYPSSANYLLWQSHHSLAGPLLDKGILIRRCQDFTGLDESFYRTAVRLPGQNEQLIRALQEVLDD